MAMTSYLSLEARVHLAALKLGTRRLLFGLNLPTRRSHRSASLVVHSLVLMMVQLT